MLTPGEVERIVREQMPTAHGRLARYGATALANRILTAATAAHEKVVESARVCEACNGKPRSWPGGIGRAMCPTCSGRGVTFGGGK